MLRPAVRLHVGGRGDQVAIHLAQPARQEGRIGQGRDADRGVETVADEVDHRIAQLQIDRHVRINREEFRQLTRLLAPPYASYRKAFYKEELLRECVELGIPAPRMLPDEEARR